MSLSIQKYNPVQTISTPQPVHQDAARVYCEFPVCNWQGVAIDFEGRTHIAKCHARTHGITEGWPAMFTFTSEPIGVAVE